MLQLLITAAATLLLPPPQAPGGDRPVKVFVLAGQSNMEGQAVVDLAGRDYNGGKGTLQALLDDPAKAPLVRHLRDSRGGWAARDDVWVRYQRENQPLLAGPLSIGFTVYGGRHHFGPELQFGHLLGDHFRDQVLLVKTAWGGKSLYKDFRPPSSGGQVGVYYTKMVEEVRAALASLKTDFPPYRGQGYELAGFVWYHGWNDGVDPEHAVPEYEQNLVNLIKDVRKEWKSPALPVVVGELTGPWVKAPGSWAALRRAQAAACARPEFRGNVLFVETHDFVRPPGESPNPSHGHHEFGNAETYFLVGDALGKGMLKLLASQGQDAPARGQTIEPPRKGEMAGYLLVPHGKAPADYDAGFSVYVAAWPLLRHYPGQQFQSGLFGTWMFAQNGSPRPKDLYSDIEGGLGWWRDTRFATETPKFIMGGVALNFTAWANGPGAGKGRDWAKPAGHYAIAQLSPWVLWPPDGLNLKQGTSGELFGYGYLPLPLTTPKATTAGKDSPTGDQCWTLFLNTGNFKGPVTFFLPYFWSRASADDPKLAGMFLDSRPSEPNKAVQMETQHIPAYLAHDKKGETYARIAPTQFPGGADGPATLLHRLSVYRKAALWDGVRAWFEGGPAASGRIDPHAAFVQPFDGKGGATWRIAPPNAARDQRFPLAWSSFVTPVALDNTTYGFRWNPGLVTKPNAKDGLVTLPEFYRLEKDPQGKERWIVVNAKDVPAETGLAQVRFPRAEQAQPGQKPYVTPGDAGSSWKQPGPVAGPFVAKLGDGSVVTYSWYRFADQPALLNADLTADEREALQRRVELLHKHWTRDRDYFPPPTVGKLADLDPALLVTPPKGLEIGYVPIVTRQSETGEK